MSRIITLDQIFKIGIFGLPGSGKSQFRRWLYEFLLKFFPHVFHYDADRKDYEEDKTCVKLEPESAIDEGAIYLVEDVRGTVSHSDVKPGKEGPWKPIEFYNYIIYLLPSWEMYSLFWAARAVQWHKNGSGDHQRESGSKSMTTADIQKRVYHYLLGYSKWSEQDKELLVSLSVPWQVIGPRCDAEADTGKIQWLGYDPNKLLKAYENFRSSAH